METSIKSISNDGESIEVQAGERRRSHGGLPKLSLSAVTPFSLKLLFIIGIVIVRGPHHHLALRPAVFIVRKAPNVVIRGRGGW